MQPDNFTPAAIFTSIALFGLMRFPLIFLPFALIQLSNALVSMRRLSSYFMLEERSDEVQELPGPGELQGCRRGGAGGWGWRLPLLLGWPAWWACLRRPARLPASAADQEAVLSYVPLPAPLPCAGLEIVDGTFFWSDPPPQPKEAGKKGGPPGGANKDSPQKKRGGLFGRKAPQKHAEAAPANGREMVVAVKLAGMQEGEDGSKPAGAAAAAGTGPVDSARESGSASPTSASTPPPEKAGKEGDCREGAAKDAAWFLRNVNLQVRGSLLACARLHGECSISARSGMGDADWQLPALCQPLLPCPHMCLPPSAPPCRLPCRCTRASLCAWWGAWAAARARWCRHYWERWSASLAAWRWAAAWPTPPSRPGSSTHQVRRVASLRSGA